MPRPYVTDQVIDLTNRVSTTSTYASAIVVAAKKGPIDTPVLIGGQTNYLRKFTPNEKLELGWDTAMYEAWFYLNTQANLYVVRAAHDALYGGCKIRTFKSSLESIPCAEGFAEIGQADFDYENDAMIIYGADQGAYNNDISVAIITDPDEVKLDGCFIVRVYKNGVAVENHVCSLDPSFLNGYNVNCFAENVLKTSLYVRCDVNDDEDAIKDTSYAINVVGTVSFDNEIIKEKSNVRRNHEYKENDIVVITDIEGATGYYICTKAGRTADTESRPSFVNGNEYLKVVEDGNAIWTLAEVVKAYEADAEYKAGEIVTITKGSNVMNFRALIDGVTDVNEPQWLEGDTPRYMVEDGTITWCNVKQTQQVSELAAYTYKKGERGSKLDLTRYAAYTDLYLAQEASLPEVVTVEDPTMVHPEFVEKQVTYVATYTGQASDKHFILPKASKKVNGAYVPTKLAGGDDGGAVTDADRIRALKSLKSTKDYTFQLIMDGGNTTPAYQRAIDDICEVRKQSCHGIIGVPFECATGMVTGDDQQDTVNYRKYTLNANSTNLELYTPHQLVYDEFNDRNLYISSSAFVAARIMDVAQTYGWHWATAGMNRGVINSLDVARTYEDTVIDTFCDNQINPILKEPGVGNVIGDDYTLLSKACDMQDAHISRYVNIYLRPAVRDALQPFLFEFNDAPTRTLITKMLETFMQPQISSRAIQAYKIVCDETNNTPSDIQNSICNVWIYIQPTHIIRWIRVSHILQPGSVDIGDIQF